MGVVLEGQVVEVGVQDKLTLDAESCYTLVDGVESIFWAVLVSYKSSISLLNPRTLLKCPSLFRSCVVVD